jgi:CRISPR-associated protein Csx10
MKLEVSLTTEAPLAISRWRATGNELETLRHVPGTAWRGALAADIVRERKLKEHAHCDSRFHALFLEGKVRFGDLRPNGAAPWPLSARECSRNQAHGVHDLLVRSALGDEIPLGCIFGPKDRACDAKLALPQGFFVWNRDLAAPEPSRPMVRIVAHTAIDGAVLLPRPGQFFSSEVVEGGTQFEGEIWLKDPALKAEFDHPRQLAIGRGATRGQGLAKLEFHPPPPPSEANLRQRVAGLNGRFESTGLVAFTCTLRSACLVYDDWLCARSYLLPSDIGEAASVPPGELEAYRLTAWFSRMITIGGWNARASLPKGDIHALAPGSAFLFTRSVAPRERDAEMDRLACILAACETGIGERWEEGFGEAVFCDPFHYALRRS